MRVRPAWVLAGILVTAMPARAGHRTFTWTAPTTNEDGTPLTDLASYRVYTCAALPCSKANAQVLGNVVAPGLSYPAPHRKGHAFVTAVDKDGNESPESTVAPFDLVAPSAPGSFKGP